MDGSEKGWEKRRKNSKGRAGERREGTINGRKKRGKKNKGKRDRQEGGKYGSPEGGKGRENKRTGGVEVGKGERK